jgi:hypothetical protein
MRQLWVGLAASLAVLIAPAGARDGATPDTLNVLTGTWSCRGQSGSIGTDLFTRNADGSITNTIRYHFDSPMAAGGEFDAIYRYDPDAKQWSWISTNPVDPYFSERGTTTQSSADLVVFEGTQETTVIPGDSSSGAPRHVHTVIRLVYTFLSPNEFRRQLDVNQSGMWRPFSSTACLRTPVAT